MKKRYFIFIPIPILLLTIGLFSCVSCRQSTHKEVPMYYECLGKKMDNFAMGPATAYTHSWSIERESDTFVCVWNDWTTGLQNLSPGNFLFLRNYKIIVTKTEDNKSLIKVSALNNLKLIPVCNLYFNRAEEKEREFIRKITNIDAYEPALHNVMGKQVTVNVRFNEIGMTNNINRSHLHVKGDVFDYKIATKLCEEWEKKYGQPLDYKLKTYASKGIDLGDKFPTSCKSKKWKEMKCYYKDKITHILIATRFSTIDEFKKWLDENKYKYKLITN